MRIALETAAVAAALLASVTLAESHPFLKEGNTERSHDHGDGRVSAKLRKVKTEFSKYQSLMYTDELFVEPKSRLEILSDYFFGAQ